MATNIKMEVVLSFLAAAFAIYMFPMGYLVLTAAITFAVYIYTRSYDAVLGTLIVMIFIRVLTTTLKAAASSVNYGAIGGPVGGTVSAAMENFQPKDPVSIHQRIAHEKKEADKVPKIYGVLESPSILSSLQISDILEPERGAPRTGMPAISGAYETIRTPAEGFMPNMSSNDSNPVMNPYLQNGPDQMAVDTALVNVGTKLRSNATDPGEVGGVAIGPDAGGESV
jgi:hypothetical protein